MPTLGRWSRLARWLTLCLALLPIGAGLAQPSAITLNGLRDPAYVLLAVDPAADLASAMATIPQYSWAELSALYVTTDTTNLYIYVSLPYFSDLASSGEIGLVIDTTGDVPNSGGTTDPWFNAVTFAYTVTHANTGTVPLNTSHIVRPEVVIRGNLPGVIPQDDGHTELLKWDGSAWTGAGVNWGGVIALELVGTHIA